MNLNNEQIITQEIDYRILKSIQQSIQLNNRDLFIETTGFVYNILVLSIDNLSLTHFELYIHFFVKNYAFVSEKHKRGEISQSMYEFSSQRSAMELRQIILYHLKYKFRSSSIQEKIILNNFFYNSFYSFSNLLYLIIKNRDEKLFKFTINELDQVISGYPDYYTLKSKIIDLERNENLNEESQRDLKEKRNELHTEEQFDRYFRHIKTGLKYWIYYLYSINKITEDEVKRFTEPIHIPSYDPKDLFQDLLNFVNHPYSYFGWSEWDFEERPSGVTYTPPSPTDWLLWGFTIDMIKENRLVINQTEIDIHRYSTIEFISNKVTENAIEVRAKYNSWKNILNINARQFLKNTNDLKSQLKIIKRRTFGTREKEIAKTPLNSERVLKFKKLIGESWKKNAVIHNIFKERKNVEEITSIDIKLLIIGRKIFYEKAKMMFIEGDHYQHIYGVERYGGDIGRWEDNEFMITTIKNNNRIFNYKSIVEGLDDGIKKLQSSGFSPNLIIMPLENSYKDEGFTTSDKFIPKWKINDTNTSIHNMGYYDGIAVVGIFSPFIDNKILVCDFENAFLMKQRLIENGFEKELQINVDEVSDKEAKEKYVDNPDKWSKDSEGNQLTEDESLALIKTSVIIEIGVIVKFEIKNEEALIIGQINNKLE